MISKLLNSIKQEFYIIKMFCFVITLEPLGMTAILLSVLITGITPVIAAFLLKNIAVIYDFNNTTTTIILLFSFYLLCNNSDSLFLAIRRLLMNVIKYRLNHKLNERIVNKVNELDIRYRESSDYATLYERAQIANDPISIMVLVEQVPQNITLVITIVTVFGVLISINIFLSLLSIFVMLPLVVLNKKSVDRLMDYQRNTSQEVRRVESLKNNFFNLDKIAEMKVFRCEKLFLSKWKFDYERLNQERIKKELKERLFVNGLSSLCNRVLIYIILLIFILFYNDSNQNIVLIISMFTSFIACLFSLSQNFGMYHFMSSIYMDYFKLLYSPMTNKTNQELLQNEMINLTNVSFSYDGVHDVIQDITFSIKKGEKIAIVGKNGSGKSTLAKLLLHIYQPKDGVITYEPYHGPQTSLKNTAVFQNYSKYIYNLRLNLTVGNEKLYHDDYAILNTIHKVGLDNVIDKEQFDFIVGMENGGVDFSGGQWQRIAIARAMLTENYHLAILDEPNSALDPISEAEIIHSFFKENIDKTCIVITHRLASLRYADKILVLENGRLIEQGSYKHLMKINGVFKAYFEKQARQYQV